MAAEAAGSSPGLAAKRVGMASYYHDWLHGKRTANGDRYDKTAMTAAHPDLPLGTRVRVTSLRNGRSVEVTINDRLPRYHRRIIDLSRAAARELGIIKRGLARVRLEIIAPDATESASR
jgi:rare lipoprotein A